LKAPITCRTSEVDPWAEGRTLNISRSGVLFALPAAADVTEDLEFVIKLSGAALQGPGVRLLPDLHCHARVVRLAAAPTGETIVAASIRRQSIRKVNDRKAN
jgi:hypothetical protein